MGGSVRLTAGRVATGGSGASVGGGAEVGGGGIVRDTKNVAVAVRGCVVVGARPNVTVREAERVRIGGR
jgi:hypothetical protein